jgi:hypothetical protein
MLTFYPRKHNKSPKKGSQKKLAGFKAAAIISREKQKMT